MGQIRKRQIETHFIACLPLIPFYILDQGNYLKIFISKNSYFNSIFLVSFLIPQKVFFAQDRIGSKKESVDV
jgi:hypothetical protein